MKIENWKDIGKGSLIGAFDLTLPSGLCFYGVLLMDGRNGPWIKFAEIPQYKDNAPVMKDGRQAYKRVVGFVDRPTSDKFSGMVLDALRAAGHLGDEGD